jgi:hypothetical protein
MVFDATISYGFLMVSQVVSFLLGSLGCLVLGVASPMFMLNLELLATLPSRLSFLLACFVRVFSHHLVMRREREFMIF